MRGSTPIIVRRKVPRTIQPSTTVLIAPQSPSTVITRLKALCVEPIARPLWDAKGWTPRPHHSRSAYDGFYEVLIKRTGQVRRFRGRLEETRRGIAAYISDPPPEIRRHPKGSCFGLVDGTWFQIHWHDQPRDADSAIVYVETVLDEALNGR